MVKGASTAERRKRNRIDSVRQEDGGECRGEKDIARAFARHFERLFTSDQPNDCDEIINGIPRTISESINRNMSRQVDDQEIRKALFSMNHINLLVRMVCLPLYFKNFGI